MKLGIIKQIGHNSSKRANINQLISKAIETVTGKHSRTEKNLKRIT